MIVCVLIKPAARALKVTVKHFPQRRRSMKASYGARPVQLMADIVKPDDFAVSRVKKGNMKAVEVEWIVSRASRISFGLCKHVLRTESEFLCFNDPEQYGVNIQRVIGGTVGRFVFFNIALSEVAQISRSVKASDVPPGASKLRIDSGSSSFSLALRLRHLR